MGIGVVAVVQDHPVVAQMNQTQSGPGGLIVRHTGDDLLLREAQQLPDGRGHSGGIDHMGAEGGNLQVVHCLGGGHCAAHPAKPPVLHLTDTHLTVLPIAAAQCGKGQVQRVQQGIIPVENHRPIGLQVLKNLRLGPENPLPAAQQLHMDIPDVGDHSDVGPDHLPSVANLPKPVHTALHHCRPVLCTQPQQRQRHTDGVVEVPLGE